jgi:hypothetical protein
MLAAKPVVVSEAADPDGLISRHRAGLVVGTELKTLVATLAYVGRLRGEDLHVMGTNGRRLVARRFQWEDTASTLLTAYEKVLRTRASR